MYDILLIAVAAVVSVVNTVVVAEEESVDRRILLRGRRFHISPVYPLQATDILARVFFDNSREYCRLLTSFEDDEFFNLAETLKDAIESPRKCMKILTMKMNRPQEENESQNFHTSRDHFIGSFRNELQGLYTYCIV
jgi:hypothetical protein